MDFHDIRLPDNIERGAEVGAEFSTTILQTASGFEKRNQNWARELFKASFSYSVLDQVGYQEIASFHRARRGRAIGFRFKDWSDYKWDDEIIGIGNSSNLIFQLIRTYEEGGIQPYIRKITRPVTGSISVTVDDTIQSTPGDYSLDFDTGVMTFSVAPDSGLLVKVTGEFDIPVRFDSDFMPLSLEWEQLGDMTAVGVMEVRE